MSYLTFNCITAGGNESLCFTLAVHDCSSAAQNSPEAFQINHGCIRLNLEGDEC